MDNKKNIRNAQWMPVCDSSFCTAFFRECESARKDALFHDPYARQLVGESDFKHIAGLPSIRKHEWFYSVRTKILDDYIMEVVALNAVDVIVNLGAGLDMRPYRLPIPSHIKWVEVDYQGLLEFKEEKIASLNLEKKPTCTVTRIACDLSFRCEREKLYRKLEKMGARWAVMAEGFLIYRPRHSVERILQECARNRETQFVITDFFSVFGINVWLSDRRKFIEDNEVELRFGVTEAEGVSFFHEFGWRPLREKYLLDEAFKLKRKPPFWWYWWYRIAAWWHGPSYLKKLRLMKGCVLLTRL